MNATSSPLPSPETDALANARRLLALYGGSRIVPAVREPGMQRHEWVVCSPTSLAHAASTMRQDRRTLCGMTLFNPANWVAADDGRDRCCGCLTRMEYRATQAHPRR